MDIEAARNGRIERIWYAGRALWRKNVMGMWRRPVVRNYLFWFALVSVLLIFRPEKHVPTLETVRDPTVPSPLSARDDLVVVVDSLGPAEPAYWSISPLLTSIQNVVPDNGDVAWMWDQCLDALSKISSPDSQAASSSEETCAASEPEPPTEKENAAEASLATRAAEVEARFDGLRSLESMRKIDQRLPKSIEIPPSFLTTTRRTRGGVHPPGQRLVDRLQTQLQADLGIHEELCLAGPQVGVPVRMMMLRSLGVLINPKLISTSHLHRTRLEARALEPTVLKQKTRPSEIDVLFTRWPEGTPREMHLNDLDAQCVLHLLDTLDAVEF